MSAARDREVSDALAVIALAIGAYAFLRGGGNSLAAALTDLTSSLIGTTGAAGASTGAAHSLSANGLAFIKAGEGFQPNLYNDVGHQAIGYGHDLKAGETIKGPISEATATQLLLGDVASASAAINAAVTQPLTQNEFDALVSFTLDVGNAAMAGSTLVKKLNAGDIQGAADQFPLWKYVTVNGAKQVSQSLVSRRARERALFLS